MKNDAIIIIFTVCTIALAISGSMAILVSADSIIPGVPEVPSVPAFPTIMPQMPQFPHFPWPTATTTPTPTLVPTPTTTPTPTPEPTLTPTPTPEPSVTPTPSPPATPTPSPTATPGTELTPTPRPSVMPSPSAPAAPEVNTLPASEHIIPQPSTAMDSATVTTPAMPSEAGVETTFSLSSWQLLILFLLGVAALVVYVRTTGKK